MKTIRRLDSSGDTAVAFDEADVKAAKEAKTFFDRMMKEGRVPFATNRLDPEGKPLPDKKIADFSEVENETVFIPRIQGG